jgi:hypothetical protein
VSGTPDTALVREQSARRAKALRLVRRDDLRLVLLPDRRVRIEGGATPEDVATARSLRAELVELLEGHRCVACGEPLAHMTRVPVGVGWAHRYSSCSGYPRPPNATQVVRE